MSEKERFLDFLQAMVRLNYAQQFQDLFALWQCGLKRNGYFVEFGALNGIDFSNTYLLEQLGWDGIVSEPHPDYSKLVHERRSCTVSTDCIWTEDGGKVTFQTVIGRPALSGIANLEYDDIAGRAGRRDNHILHEVPTIRLETLMHSSNAPLVPDFLSIDTEGSELQILSDFDFDRYRFKAIAVEHGFSAQREPLKELLTARGYERKWPEISDHDDWYVCHDTPFEPEKSADQYQQFIAHIASSLPQTNHLADRQARLAKLVG